MKWTQKERWGVLLLAAFLVLTASPATAQNDTIINRYRQYLLRTDTTRQRDVQRWKNSLQANGRWPDIQYDDVEPAAWKIPDHLKRIQEMATLLISPRSSFYNDPALMKTISQALDHWLGNRYQSTNWWHNEIGVPRYMRDIIILLRDRLDATRLNKSLEILAQLRVHENYVAGNLIWCADLGLHYGALVGDSKLVQRCRDLIIREIKIGTGEGMQPDHSFQQHGHRLQMFQYGKAYIWESLRVAWELRDTPLAFPRDKVDALTDIVLEGWQWMSRGIYTVPGTMDRSSSRVGELKAADIRPLLPFIKALQPWRADALASMALVQDQKKALNGFRYFPYSDFMVYHRPAFSFFLKTISTRTLATESINRENLKGKLLNSGDAHLIQDGTEYTDLMPVWNWTMLPGVTAFEGAHRIERKAFVGSAGDGESGVTAMDYVIQDSSGQLAYAARKFWACHGDQVICLIRTVNSRVGALPVYTAMDQCRLQGPVYTSSEKRPLTTGSHLLHNPEWLYHNGFAYIPLTPASVQVQMGTVKGNWHSINNATSAATVTEQVFLPVLMHPAGPGDSTGYALVKLSSAAKAGRLVRQPNWEVLANRDQVQALRWKDGSLMVAFYTQAALPLLGEPPIRVNRACLMMVQRDQVLISDPSFKGGPVTLSLKGKSHTIELPKDGTTVAVILKK